MVYAGGAMKDRHDRPGHVFQGCAAGLLLVGAMLFLIRPSQPAQRMRTLPGGEP